MSLCRVMTSILKAPLPSVRAECACVIGVSTVRKLHRSYSRWKQRLVRTYILNGMVGDVSVHICEFLPMFIVVDRCASDTNNGYYSGQKSK